VITDDIRGEGDGPITTVLFPDDYRARGLGQETGPGLWPWPQPSGSPTHRSHQAQVASLFPPQQPPAQRRALPRPPRPARVGPGRLAQPLPRGAAWRAPARSSQYEDA
jgi:hypothetical protein